MKHNFKILTDEYWKRFSDSGICSLSDYPIPLTFSFQIYKTKSSLENVIQPRNCRMVELMVMLKAYVSHCHRAVRLA